MPSHEDELEELRLDEPAQLALAAGYLDLMEAELEVDPTIAACAVVEKFREGLADGPLGPMSESGLLTAEEDDDRWEDLLHAVRLPAPCLTVLVDLCAAQPFAGMGRRLDERPRSDALGAIAISLGGDVDEDDIELIDHYLAEGQEASKSQTMKWVLVGLGGVAGLATGGLAAPAIGAAIGGAMGLSGAAAGAAGLAALGGGSLAAGGFGMAGGTIVVAAAGGLMGAGAGGFARLGLSPKRLEVEAVKLFSLVRVAEDHIDRVGPGCDDGLKRVPQLGRTALGRLAHRLDVEATHAEMKKDHDRANKLNGAKSAVERLHRRLG